MSDAGVGHAFEIEGVSWQDEDRNAVLADIALAVPRGAQVALVGHSGAAQTALLRLLAGVIAPNAGVVRAFGKNLAELSYEQMREHRMRIGYVFEATGLIGNLSLGDNIALPLAYHGDRELRGIPLDRTDKVKRVARELAIERYLAAPVFRVSASVRKRALVARALVREPDLLLCDEPLARLTKREAKLVSEAFERRRRARAMTVLLAGHNEDFAPFAVDELVHLERDPLSMVTSLRPGSGPLSLSQRTLSQMAPIIQGTAPPRGPRGGPE
jgi:ABC-type lipoprotein export system ATPase subunit